MRSSFSSTRYICHLAVLGALVLPCAYALSRGEAVREQPPKTATELFDARKVWPVHLTFTAENWLAMDPDGGKPPANGRFPGAPGGGGPGPGGGPPGGGRGGGRGGMGPAMFMAPEVMKLADADKDGKLSEKEFASASDALFAKADKASTESISQDALREALTAIPRPGGPGGGGPRFQAEDGRRNGLAGSMGIDFKFVKGDLNFSGQEFKEIAARYKGNSTFMASRTSLKKSMKLDLNKYVKGQKLDEVSTINLHSNVMDPGWMNEVLSYRLYADAGVHSPRTSYAQVYVTVPGKYNKDYMGLYTIVEDVDKEFFKSRTAKKDGAIFKPSTHDLFKDLGDDWKSYNQIYDPKVALSANDKKRMMDFSRLVTKADDKEFEAQVGEYLDLDQFARYMAVTVYLSTMDSILGMGQNFYIYLDPGCNKLQFIPWDMDGSFGKMGMGSDVENLSIRQPWRGQNRFLERVFKVAAFKQLYMKYMQDFSKTIFLPSRLASQVDELAVVLRPVVAQESKEKMERFEYTVSGAGNPPAGGGGPDGRGPGRAMAQAIKTFVTARARSVEEQLNGREPVARADGRGFGGPGGPGGRGGGMRGPGPEGLAPQLFTKLDADGNGAVTRAEWAKETTRLFRAWDEKGSGFVTLEQLQSGIAKDLFPMPPGGGRGGPGGFPPPGGPFPPPMP